MLFEIDASNNIRIARGYDVTFPVEIKKADGTEYNMLNTDVLTFSVRTSASSQTDLIKITSNNKSISLPTSATADMEPGTYLYDITLNHKGWLETIVTPKNFIVSGNVVLLINEYRKLLTSEYRHSPKLKEWLLWLLNDGTDYATFIHVFVNAFDLDRAVGQQLDIIGRYVGVSRMLNFQPSGGESPLLNDDTYRFLIRATIVKNTWKGNVEDLYSAWKILFSNIPLFQIQDLQDMTFNVVIGGDFTTFETELITKGYIVPKPEGVRIRLMTITPLAGYPLFSYDLDTLYYSGYTANWAIPTP